MDHFPVVKISQNDEQYPELLRHIHKPPEVLYCRGNIKLLATLSIGVVGTRKMTPYGKEAVEYIVSDLVRAGMTVTSGLAMGIDAAAHQTTIDHGGNTIAVLGGGVDDKTIGPRTNFRLAQNILAKNGLIISEYEPGQPGQPFTFPARNRIISGLSRGIVVIEADEESGALITAKFALEQNRDVFAIPGTIFSPRSIGTNNLIQKGAKLILSAQDILDEYGHLNLEQTRPDNAQGKSPMEQTILAVLAGNGPIFVDEIIRVAGHEPAIVLSTLSLMEIKGSVKHIGNGMYRSV